MAIRNTLFSGSVGGSNQSGYTYVPVSSVAPAPVLPPYFNYGKQKQPQLPINNRILDATTALTPTGFADVRATTATYENSSGVVSTASANTARIDYDFNGSSWVVAGIYNESAATNYAPDSSNIGSSSGWNLWNTTTISATNISDPSGGSTGARILFGSGTDAEYYTAGNSTPTTVNYTISVWVKSTSSEPFRFKLALSAVGNTYSPDISTSTSWTRYSYTFTGNDLLRPFVNISIASASTHSATNTIDAWGVQIEATNTLTSYIPSTTSATTRAADSLSFTIGSAATSILITYDTGSVVEVDGLTGGATYTFPIGMGRILYVDDNAQVTSNVGSSAGTNTATAVGAWLQSGIGSSAGSNTSAATGQAIFNAVGSSAGSNTATAVGAELQAGVGSSTGTNAALAVGSDFQAGVGSSAGTNTATATAAPIQARPGSSAGSNTATAVGAWLQAGVGSSAGDNTATATGANLQIGVGSSAGANTSTATGQAIFNAAGSSAGTNTSSATAAWLQSGVGSSAGTDTVTGTGHWLQSGVGNAQGDNTASGYSPGVSNVGSSSGTNTATGVGHWLQSGVGSSTGTNTASGIGSFGGIVTGDGLSIGANIATAIGAWLQSGVGESVGGNVASGIVSVTEADFNNDFAQDFSGFPGAGTGFSQGDFNDDFNDDFAVFHVGRIVSGTGTSVGGNIAEAVGSTIVFIPPVYPPAPVPPPQVWHPAQEYHRVQAPRANRTFRHEQEYHRVQAPRAIRVYRHGTDLKRLPPRIMKRRYG